MTADPRRELSAPSLPVRVAAGLLFNFPPAFHHQKACDRFVEKVPVVADQNNRAFKFEQDFFQ